MLSGRIITLPETMSRRIDMNNPLQVKIEGITYNVPPNCFINSPDGSFKVSLLCFYQSHPFATRLTAFTILSTCSTLLNSVNN